MSCTCLFFRLHVGLPTCLSACLLAYLRTCFSACTPACLTVCLPACIHACLPTRLTGSSASGSPCDMIIHDHLGACGVAGLEFCGLWRRQTRFSKSQVSPDWMFWGVAKQQNPNRSQYCTACKRDSLAYASAHDLSRPSRATRKCSERRLLNSKANSQAVKEPPLV